MRTSELDYALPEERIAQHPLPRRDDSRLLVVHREPRRIEHHQVRDLPRLLGSGDLLVRNASRVIAARLHGHRTTGGRVEFLLLQRGGRDRWKALARPASRLRENQVVTLDSGFRLTVERDRALPEAERWLAAPGLDAEVERSGEVPLPPYIRRNGTPEDRERYQTVYATRPGSVAAPTAGLHFTDALLDALAAANIPVADVLLHIGPATFSPLRVDEVEQHPMHAEYFEVPQEVVARVGEARTRNARVVAVGTSSVRALEAASGSGELEAARGPTRLFIAPGYRFRVVTGLLTNFHQPRSPLLALVAAFAGLDLLKASYQEALRERYRFLSYGDAMLVL